MATQYIRKLQTGEERANAREAVVKAARKGDDPSCFKAEDLEWAFRGHEDELAQLENVAAEARAARKRHATSGKIAQLANTILAEWDKAEKEERRARAFEEARKRLGL